MFKINNKKQGTQKNAPYRKHAETIPRHGTGCLKKIVPLLKIVTYPKTFYNKNNTQVPKVSQSGSPLKKKTLSATTL